MRRAFQCPCNAVVLDLEAFGTGCHEAGSAGRRQRRADSTVRHWCSGPMGASNPAGPQFDANLAAIDWSTIAGVFVAQAEDPEPLDVLDAPA